MKKLLSLLAIAGVMVACNNGADEMENDDTMMIDTTTTMPPVYDTTTMGDTSMRMGDTTTMR